MIIVYHTIYAWKKKTNVKKREIAECSRSASFPFSSDYGRNLCLSYNICLEKKNVKIAECSRSASFPFLQTMAEIFVYHTIFARKKKRENC